MAQPPQFPIQKRELNRVIPFATQKTFRNAALGNGATMIAAFDIGLVVTDFNQFIGATINAANNPSADPTPFAIGPLMDALWFSTAAGSVLVEMAVDYTCSYRSIATTAAVAGVAGNISGLRITGRFLRVTYTNTSGGAALVEFGVYVRSA